MSFTVIVKEEAHQDTIEAYNYYEKKAAGLRVRFLEALQQRYNEIQKIQHFTAILMKIQ